MNNKEKKRYIPTDVKCPFCNEKLSQDTRSSGELQDPDDPEKAVQGIVLMCIVCGTHVLVSEEMAKEEGIPYKLR